jgi:transposase-like protein
MKPGLAGHWERERIASASVLSSDEKRLMVAESFAPDASVSKVVQRYGVNANLVHLAAP